MKLKNMILGAVSAMTAFAFAACSNINENERLIYVEPDIPDDSTEVVTRAVLIEDFTGQRCVNCPNGTEAISKIMETYGEDNIIAVGVHSGSRGFAGNSKVVGLKTETGDEYYNYFKIEAQPCALFNRRAKSLDYTQWASFVRDEISAKARLSVSIDNSYDDASRTLTTAVSAMGTDGTTQGKLQVWLVEDGITAMQLMPDDSANSSYVHNHVFRAAVNGTWGEDVTVKEGETTAKQYTYTLPETWNADKVSVVAFVYNDGGVEQTAKKAVIKATEE